MEAILQDCFNGTQPFCIFQKEHTVTLVQGHIQELNYLDEISAQSGSLPIKSVSMIPYCQIKERGFKALGCFGHQVICRNLGLRLARLDVPLQGVQKEILLFGEKQIVGFYNTFVVVVEDFNHEGFHISVNEAEEVNAIKGPNFYSFQFHVESVLTRNGLDILKYALCDLSRSNNQR